MLVIVKSLDAELLSRGVRGPRRLSTGEIEGERAA